MTYREDFEEKKLEYLTELKGKIMQRYDSHRKLTKARIAEVGGMSNTEFSRFINTPGLGLSDERLKKLEDWLDKDSNEEICCE